MRRAPVDEFEKLDERISYWDRLLGMHCVAKMGLPDLVRYRVGAGVNPLVLDGNGHAARSRAEFKLRMYVRTGHLEEHKYAEVVIEGRGPGLCSSLVL